MDALFAAGLGVVNASCLLSWGVQWRPLVGEKGVTPAQAYVARAKAVLDVTTRSALSTGTRDDEPATARPFAAPSLPNSVADFFRQAKLWRSHAQQAWHDLQRCPSLFLYTGASDRMMSAYIAVGYICSVMLFMGWLPSLAAVTFAIIWASIANVSNPWTGLQFESLLCETNAAFALGYLFSWATPSAWVLMQRWLIFRLMLGAGAGKWGAGDKAWRDGRAMTFHYLTQPLPNGLSRFMHTLPAWWHKVETHLTFLFEGPLALLFFVPDWRARLIGFLGTVQFNVTIAVTGNYGFLHMCCILMSTGIITELGSGAVAPWCSATSAAQHSGGVLSALLTPAWVRALATWWSLPANASAAAAAPALFYQGCPASVGLVSPLLAKASMPALLRATSSVWSSFVALITGTNWMGPVGLAAAATQVLTIFAANVLWLAGWAAGWAVCAAYVAVSAVPFAANFRNLVELQESVPGWSTVEEWADILQRWRLVGMYALFNHVSVSTPRQDAVRRTDEAPCRGCRCPVAAIYHSVPMLPLCR